MANTQDLVTVAGQNMSVAAPTAAEQAAGKAAADYFNALINAGVPNSVAQKAMEQHYGTMGSASPPTVSGVPAGAGSMQLAGAGDTRQPGDQDTSNPNVIWRPGVGMVTIGGPGEAGGAGAAGGAGGGQTMEQAQAAARQWEEMMRQRAASGARAGSAGAPDLNVPYGAAFFQPILAAIMQMLGLGENRRQFNVTALADARANPYDASQLAFRRAGLGLDPFATQAGGLDVAKLAADPTLGAGTSSIADIMGNKINVPGTLTGKALANLQGNPTGQGVISSFANTAGNADILQRSAAALLPALFGGGVGTGLG